MKELSPFSGMVRVLSNSKTLFNRSRTLSYANEISSINNNPPWVIACTKGPSYHIKIPISSPLFGLKDPIKSAASV